MNRLPLSKSRLDRGRKPRPLATGAELTLQLPIAREQAHRVAEETPPKRDEQPRGVAVVDFYL